MVKMYHHTKDEVSMSTHSKVIAQIDRQTDTHRYDQNINSQVVINPFNTYHVTATWLEKSIILTHM